jgi:hypothetical protein
VYVDIYGKAVLQHLKKKTTYFHLKQDKGQGSKQKAYKSALWFIKIKRLAITQS